MSLAKTILKGLALATAGTLLGCNQPDAPNKKHAGASYTAARHMRVGSNIPQPDSADSVDSVSGADQATISRQVSTQQVTPVGGGGAGGR